MADETTSRPAPEASVPAGTDTRTGTDPGAKYEQPGYEDKSFGQAVGQDQELADRLVDEADGDTIEAERQFRDQSAGAPAAERQSRSQSTGD